MCLRAECGRERCGEKDCLNKTIQPEMMFAQNEISNFVPQFGGMKLEKQAKFRSWCPFKGFQGKINLTSIFSLLIQCVPSTVLVTRMQ